MHQINQEDELSSESWLWKRYHDSNAAYDQAFINKWKNDLDGVLIFVRVTVPSE